MDRIIFFSLKTVNIIILDLFFRGFFAHFNESIFHLIRIHRIFLIVFPNKILSKLLKLLFKEVRLEIRKDLIDLLAIPIYKMD